MVLLCMVNFIVANSTYSFANYVCSFCVARTWVTCWRVKLVKGGVNGVGRRGGVGGGNPCLKLSEVLKRACPLCATLRLLFKYRECPLLAQSGSATGVSRLPLSGA